MSLPTGLYCHVADHVTPAAVARAAADELDAKAGKVFHWLRQSFFWSVKVSGTVGRFYPVARLVSDIPTSLFGLLTPLFHRLTDLSPSSGQVSPSLRDLSPFPTRVSHSLTKVCQ
jgi:hypothetical protein